jgi:hypothetical protein
MKNKMVTDMNGIEIKPGQTVIVHQTEGKSEAKVIAVFPENMTVNKPGFWVGIDKGNGEEGVMSYILEVKNNESNKPERPDFEKYRGIEKYPGKAEEFLPELIELIAVAEVYIEYLEAEKKEEK